MPWLTKAMSNIHTKNSSLNCKSRFNEMFGDLLLNEFKWDYASFNEFAKFDTKMISDFSNFIDLPHIGIDSIEKNTGKLIGYRTVGEDQISSGKYLFTKKHIIYSKIRPNLNKVALPDFMGVCSADAYPILTVDEKMNRIFLAHVLRSDYFLNFILSFSSRTNLPKVNKSQISKFVCPLPPLSLQNEFADFVAQVDKSQFACGIVIKLWRNSLKSSII
ncbi:restriction endonuclease subunit S [Streptococcus oralis]|uniref:restriction endonuclease subunit S n=1 Tax=Streptococcus oralis TaxID=1303 RepID=UPI0009B7589D